MDNSFYETDNPFHTSPCYASYDLYPSDGITGLEIASPFGQPENMEHSHNQPDMFGFVDHSTDGIFRLFESPHETTFSSNDILFCTPPPSDMLLCTPPPSDMLLCTPPPSDMLPLTPPQSDMFPLTPLSSEVFLSAPLSDMSFPPSEILPSAPSTAQFEECTSQEPVHYGLAGLNTQVPPPYIPGGHMGETRLEIGVYSLQMQYEEYLKKFEEFSQKKTQLQKTGSKSRPKIGRLESLNLVAFIGIEGTFGSSKEAFCCNGIVTLQPGRGCVLVKLKTIQKANPKGELANELRRADEGARKGVEEIEKVGRMVWDEREEFKTARLVSTGKEVFSSKILMSTITKIMFRPTEAPTESSMGRGRGGGGGGEMKEHFLLQIFTNTPCQQENVISLVVRAAEKDVRQALDVFVHGVRCAKEKGTKGMLKGERKRKGMMNGQEREDDVAGKDVVERLENLILEGKFVPNHPTTYGA